MISSTLIISIGIFISFLAIIYSVFRMAKMSNAKTFEFSILVKVAMVIILILAFALPYYLHVLDEGTELYVKEIKVLNEKLEILKVENEKLRNLLKNTSNEEERKKIKNLLQKNKKLQKEIISLKEIKNRDMESYKKAINSYEKDIIQLEDEFNANLSTQKSKFAKLEEFYQNKEDSLIQIFNSKLRDKEKTIQGLKNNKPQIENKDASTFAAKYEAEVIRVIRLQEYLEESRRNNATLNDIRNQAIKDYQYFAERTISLMSKLDQGDPLTLRKCGTDFHYYMCQALEYEKNENKDILIRRKQKQAWVRYKEYIPSPFCK